MFNRVLALLIRYKTISFGSFPRLISIFYWPSVQILFWGFFTNFLVSNNTLSSWGVLNIILTAVDEFQFYLCNGWPLWNNHRHSAQCKRKHKRTFDDHRCYEIIVSRYSFQYAYDEKFIG